MPGLRQRHFSSVFCQGCGWLGRRMACWPQHAAHSLQADLFMVKNAFSPGAACASSSFFHSRIQGFLRQDGRPCQGPLLSRPRRKRSRENRCKSRDSNPQRSWLSSENHGRLQRCASTGHLAVDVPLLLLLPPPPAAARLTRRRRTPAGRRGSSSAPWRPRRHGQNPSCRPLPRTS